MQYITKFLQTKSELVFPLCFNFFLFYSANYQNFWNFIDVKGKTPNKEIRTHTHTHTISCMIVYGVSRIIPEGKTKQRQIRKDKNIQNTSRKCRNLPSCQHEEEEEKKNCKVF